MNLHQYAETHEVTNQPPSLDGANLYRLTCRCSNGRAITAQAGPRHVSMPTARWPVGR